MERVGGLLKDNHMLYLARHSQHATRRCAYSPWRGFVALLLKG